MQDVAVALQHKPGSLADMGDALGRARLSVEGGGAFVVDGHGIGHFLFEDGAAARAVLESSGFSVLEVRDVLVQKLNQAEPGQLGALTRRMAEAGVNIELLYSDHAHRMILGVDNLTRGEEISREWEHERTSKEAGRESKLHSYSVKTLWTGNEGTGTRSYRSYSRKHDIHSAGKTPIEASSDPAFRGDPSRYNPEELLVASLSSCHMLWYLHLCSTTGVNVIAYEDDAEGVMSEERNGSGRFLSVCLHPSVTVSDAVFAERATSLHEKAHEFCFIAKSVNFPVTIEPEIIVQTA